MHGVKAALARLHQVYPCYMVANARDSDTAQIWGALEQGEINQNFSYVFTKLETGYGKSTPEHYIQIARQLDLLPEPLVMIGNDYC